VNKKQGDHTMKRLLPRLIFGLLFAVPFVLVTAVWARADSVNVYSNNADLDCQSCHPAFTTSWENSAHSQAMSDSEFQNAWIDQGRPQECLTCHATTIELSTGVWIEEGITCEACHSPVPETHPNDPMPTDRSAEFCGKCHTETYFEWQVSHHRQAELDCVDCHVQHSTGLKTDGASELCSSCHRERASGFAHTAHSEEGLSCSDCHLAPLDGDMGDGHAKRDHSFHVKLSTCNECHAYQMHDPGEVHIGQAETQEPDADPIAAVEASGISLEPDPVSPGYYILIAGLVGMAFGLLLAPWIERWYHRLTDIKIDKDERG
jgi:hypothetical protein